MLMQALNRGNKIFLIANNQSTKDNGPLEMGLTEQSSVSKQSDNGPSEMSLNVGCEQPTS